MQLQKDQLCTEPRRLEFLGYCGGTGFKLPENIRIEQTTSFVIMAN